MRINRLCAFAVFWVGFVAQSALADERIDDVIAALVPDGRYAEVALWIDGEMHTGSNVPVGDKRVFVLASVSKAVLAVAIMQLHERGDLYVDDPLPASLSDELLSMVDGVQNATIAHLLTMRSGLPEYLTDDFLTDWFAGVERTKTPWGALTYAKGLPAEFVPGEAFQYTNTNYVLAQLVLEEIRGQSMSAYFKDELLKPAGMRSTGTLGFSKDEDDLLPGFEDITNTGKQRRVDDLYDGQGFGDGGLATRAEDVVKFYKALLVDKKLLGEDALEQLLTPGPDEDYAMGLVVEGEKGQRTISHGGSFIGYVSHAIYFEEGNIIGASLIGDASADAATLINDALDALLE